MLKRTNQWGLVSRHGLDSTKDFLAARQTLEAFRPSLALLIQVHRLDQGGAVHDASDKKNS